MDHFFCMRAFTRVVELRSFARASEALEVSRPTVTTAVARLEKRLGVRLLQRTTRRLSLTEDGSAYYEGCVRILRDLAETEDALSSARSSPRGRLRVSIPHSFNHLAFMPALPKFLERYPGLELEIVMTDRAVNMIEEGIDCAVRAVVDTPGDSTLVARHVAEVRWLTCAAPGYLRKHGVPRAIGELERHNCVRFVSQSSGRVLDWSFAKGGERASYAPRGNLAVTALEAAAAAAVHGVGIAQVPDALAVPMLQAGKLKPVLTDWVAAAPSMKIVYPSNRYLSAKVRAFGDFVAGIYPSKGWWKG